MNKRQWLTPGLYRVYWKKDHSEGEGGGVSLAAVGIAHDGSNWLAPCNWTGQVETFIRADGIELLYVVTAIVNVWDKVERIEKIEVDHE